MKLCVISPFEKYTDTVQYHAVSSKKNLSVTAARNGYESAQFLLFAEADFSYDVKVSDLTAEDGTVYTASNISVFAEKYIYVDRNWQTNGLPTGNYPDALLPIENAVAYGETQIKAGKNKGVWLDFFVPSEQKPVTYHGVIMVSGDGTIEIPIILKVVPVDIPERFGVRSLFTTNYDHMSHYEKGDMRQMYDKYIDYLLKHRICQTEFYIPREGEDRAKCFAEKAAKLVAKGYNSISIPSGKNTYEGQPTFDEELLEQHLAALAEKSLECGTDLIQYVSFYDWHIDEPFYVNYKPGKVEDAVIRFSQTAEKVAAQCANNSAYASSLGQCIIHSLKNCCHLITDYYENPLPVFKQKTTASGEPYQYDRSKVTLCPPYNGYASEKLAAGYAQCQQRWWYGCNCPGAPFVSYHIDDATFSPRLIGNLMAYYNIRGTLYWVNNIYTEINTTGKPLFLDDPYQVAHRGFGANGDGAILYPGSLYGVEGPVGCIRLKQIRNGFQDYDVLCQTMKAYAALGMSFQEIMHRQLCYLCDCSKIDSILGSFEPICSSFLSLSQLVMSELQLTVSCRQTEYGSVFEIRSAENCEIYVNGKNIDKHDGVYTFEMPYIAGLWFMLKVCSEYGEHSIPVYQGRGMEIILHESLYENQAVEGFGSVVVLNPDGVRREITVHKEEPGLVHIQLPNPVHQGEELGFEIRTTEPCFCTIYADGYEHEKYRLRTIPRWNRLQVSTNAEGFVTSGINIQFEAAGKFGIGAVYIRR